MRLNRAAGRDKIAEVVALCSEALKRDPNDHFALAFISTMYWNEQKRQLALPFALRILYTSPNDFEALRMVVDAYTELGEHALAYFYAKRLCEADSPAPLPIRKSSHFLFPLIWIPKIRRARDSLVDGIGREENSKREWLQWAREYVIWYESEWPVAE